MAVALRRLLFRAGVLSRERMPVPVVVVGNIVAGGTGKTPLVIWLCEFLAAQGYSPGIVSRGYGGAGQTVAVAGPAALAAGDEPALLAQRTGCPVWVGRNRARAARRLLDSNPSCDVIVADDGLQHYGLARDVEIAVVDGMRGNGNGLMLPAGPLRERRGRLDEVDAVVVTGRAASAVPGAFAMALEGRRFRNLLNPAFLQDAAAFNGLRVHAIAGIGNPERFFDSLQRLGLSFVAHAFDDHHDYCAADLEFAGAEAIVMTEKDAIKCQRFARENHWVLPVDARVDAALGELVLRKLKNRHGP